MSSEIASRKIEAALAAGILSESSYEGAQHVYTAAGMDALDRFLDEIAQMRAEQSGAQTLRWGDGHRWGDGSRWVGRRIGDGMKLGEGVRLGDGVRLGKGTRNG